MTKIKFFLGLTAIAVILGGAFFVSTSLVEAHTRTVKIKVDKNGFSPATIDVEAGHKLNLVFNRADKSGCGTEVVFPKLKIRKALPVGKNVVVSLNPTKAGEINFTCGMGMMKGKLIVSD